MPYYVYALVDERPAGRPGRGIGGTVSSRAVPGGFAVVERRADVPPAEFGVLKKHDSLVSRIASKVPAILPVRFGTLLEMEEIEEALQDREEEIADAFTAVRGRVQFTWRSGRREGRTPAPTSRITSGTAYLRQAAAAAAPPAVFRSIREKLRPLIVSERYQAPASALPGALYHLVDRGAVERYRLIGAGLTAGNPLARMTGPFPPFAFTPDLL